MKEYVCVQVNHHKNIAKVIQEHLIDGWHLHTYQATGHRGMITHYLLFERGQPLGYVIGARFDLGVKVLESKELLDNVTR